MISIFWFRRDLRLHDNAGLYRALKSGNRVQPIFIFDRNILDKLPDNKDPRVSFIHEQITSLKETLNKKGSDLQVYYGTPSEVFKKLFKTEKIARIYCNRDYESYAIARDEQVSDLANANGTAFLSYKDHLIFSEGEVLKDDGLPYTVFTPYKRKWFKKLDTKIKDGQHYYFKSYPCEKYYFNFRTTKKSKMLSLSTMGFESTELKIPSDVVPSGLIKKYDQHRDFPSIDGTSKLGVHFRFGTISIREKARKAMHLNATYLSELIWRDFYAQILHHFPHVENEAFRVKYMAIEWRNNEEEFKKWCAGQTGYPMVDAGMRELNNTGHMHNRVRMVVASFLTKHLLIDWRWGEQYFADKLLDFDLASNNGGWQWAAGCGTDAAPYFRIFNPESQMKKFDKELKYIKKWVPEYRTTDYVTPVVEHKFARERCLKRYKDALANA